MTCRFAIVGWSDGGIVALLAAIHNPEAVTKVCHFHLHFSFVIGYLCNCNLLKNMPEIHDIKKSQFPHRVVAAIKMENKWTNFIFIGPESDHWLCLSVTP